MKIGGVGNINMGVVSRPMSGPEGSAHDNGRRVHGEHDSFRSDFRTLVRAVKSGDMASAQSALAAIKTDVASSGATYSPASTTASPESAIGSDLKSLFDAVGSADASGAQAALVKFASDRRDAWQSQSAVSSNAQADQYQVHVEGGHQGRRHFGLESLIASLFSNAAPAEPTPETPATAPTDSTTPTETTTAPGSTEAPTTTAA